MGYGHSLYQSNRTYTVHRYKNRAEWLKGRQDLHGIGGSDASSVLGLNPWRTNLQLWRIKTGRETAPDISNKSYVQYGSEEEKHLRAKFQRMFGKEYAVEYMNDVILQNNEHPEMLYSPDGLLIDKEGRKGILEIKTTNVMSSRDREKWYDWRTKQESLPDNYYVQVLHGLNVTGFDFVKLYAELIYPDKSSWLIVRSVEREEVEGDLKTIKDGIIEFWRQVEEDEEPGQIINDI